MAEALALGVPVVCSDYRYAGSTLMDGALSIPAEMKHVLPEESFYWEPDMHWASVRFEAAVEALLQIRESARIERHVSPARTEFSTQRLASVYSELLTGARP
jgi:glycosyltransferase involved in cell wall biosynthesis